MTAGATTTLARPACDHLDALESEAIHIIREVAGEFERPVILFSGGKDSIVHAAPGASRRSGRRRCRSRCCTSTPGTTSPRSSSTATRVVERYGLRLVVAQRAGLHRRRPARASAPTAPATRCRPCRCSTPSPSTLRRGVRRRPARRGEGPRQGAGLLPARRVRPVGPAPPAPRAVEPLQRPAPARRARPRLPAVATGPSWTSGTTSSARRSSCPSIYYAHEREVFLRDGMWLTPGEWGGPRAARTSRAARSATARSATCPAPAPSSPTPPTVDEVIAESPPAGSPSAAPPGPTTGVRGRHGRPQARGLLLMSIDRPRRRHAASAPRHGRHRRRRQVAPWSAACCTTPSRCSPTSSTPSSARRRTAAGDTPTWRCSPTACAPSASRASPSTWPTATSPRRSARSSSPTPPATCSTPATWSPAPPPPSSSILLVDARNGRRRADPPARRGRRAAGRPARRARGQQDGPGRLRRGRVRRIADGVHRATRALGSASTTSRRSRSRRCTATTSPSRSANMPWYGGPDAARAPRVGPGRRRPATAPFRLPGAVRDPPADRRAPRLPRLRRARSPPGSCASATRSPCCPSGTRSTVERHRHARRRARRRLAAAVVTLRARRRPRHLARRPHRRRRGAPRAGHRTSTPPSAWLHEKPLRPGARLLLKHGTRTVKAIVEAVPHRLDTGPHRSTRTPASWRSTTSAGCARVAEPLPVDAYDDSRRTGSFLLIDPQAGDTLGAGLVGRPLVTRPLDLPEADDQ